MTRKVRIIIAVQIHISVRPVIKARITTTVEIMKSIRIIDSLGLFRRLTLRYASWRLFV